MANGYYNLQTGAAFMNGMMRSYERNVSRQADLIRYERDSQRQNMQDALNLENREMQKFKMLQDYDSKIADYEMLVPPGASYAPLDRLKEQKSQFEERFMTNPGTYGNNRGPSKAPGDVKITSIGQVGSGVDNSPSANQEVPQRDTRAPMTFQRKEVNGRVLWQNSYTGNYHEKGDITSPVVLINDSAVKRDSKPTQGKLDEIAKNTVDKLVKKAGYFQNWDREVLQNPQLLATKLREEIYIPATHEANIEANNNEYKSELYGEQNPAINEAVKRALDTATRGKYLSTYRDNVMTAIEQLGTESQQSNIEADIRRKINTEADLAIQRSFFDKGVDALHTVPAAIGGFIRKVPNVLPGIAIRGKVEQDSVYSATKIANFLSTEPVKMAKQMQDEGSLDIFLGSDYVNTLNPKEKVTLAAIKIMNMADEHITAVTKDERGTTPTETLGKAAAWTYRKGKRLAELGAEGIRKSSDLQSTHMFLK